VKIISSLLSAIFAVLVLASPGKTADAPVRIGFAIAKPGFLATSAKPQINAYELWKDLVNARGGLDVKGVRRTIEFVDYDDQSDANKSLQIYEKLIVGDKVDLLLAPYGSPAHIAVVGVLERNQFPVVGNNASSVTLRELKPGYMWFTSGIMPDHFAKSQTINFLASSA
jgi:branched-chain amino acid transport system substrate-binding protein